MKSPVSDHDEDDEDFEASSDKMDSPPIGGGRQKRAAALKQKGQRHLSVHFNINATILKIFSI